MIDKETRKTSAIKAKFTNSGKSEKGDGHSKRFSGWLDEGLTIYNIRYDAIGVNQQQYPGFDQDQLELLVKQYGELKDKAKDTAHEASPVQPRHDMPWNLVAPPISQDKFPPIENADEDDDTSVVDEEDDNDDDNNEVEFEGDDDCDE